jgi:hypothetical protein
MWRAALLLDNPGFRFVVFSKQMTISNRNTKVAENA